VQNGISLTTTGGNFYGLHNKKSGGLRLTSGGNVAAGSQGEAGAPFAWTTKGWGLLADMESGNLTYGANSITLNRGGSLASTVSWTPKSPTVNDTIVVSISSTKTGKLHWGINYSGHSWEKPDSVYWPKGSALYSDNIAVESPFSSVVSGTITARIGPFNNSKQAVNSLAFVVHYDDNTWDNLSGNDYHIDYGAPSDTAKKNDFEMYLVFGKPADIINGVTDVSGKPPLFPKASMGFLNSQWGTDQTELLSMVSTYRAKQIPIDAYILDFDWMAWGSDNYGEFRFGPKFPLASGGTLRDSLLKSGVKLYGIRKPRVHTYTFEGQYAKAHNFFVDYVTDYFSGKEVGRMNFYKPEARQWYYNCFINQGHAYSDGMIGYWNDEADEYGNSFNFLQMQRANYEGQRQYNNRRVWSINRNFFLGAQRYAYGHWSGDINTGFSTMAEQAPFMLTSILVGSSWWGMDIGGFNGHPSNDNYYRWIQFGAFVPIFRVHGTLNEKREPWFYGTEAEQIATQYIRLRYKLLPYIYSAAWQNHLTGLSIARPLLFSYPDDQNVTDLTDEWLFGDNMLVKPVLTQNATSVSVYLPQGKWVDYWNGKTYTGPASLNYSVDHSTIPVFVRAGAVIPTAPQGQYSDDPQSQGMLVFSCYPGESGNSFVYEDDGDSYQYENGSYAITNFAQVQTGSMAELTIGARTGSYQPPVRDYLGEFNFIKNVPDSVIVNKVPVSQTTAALLLNSSGTGWAYDADNAKCYVRLKDDGGNNDVRLYGNHLTGIENANRISYSYELHQNYPNPFNPSTIIRYQVAVQGLVTIKIYNVLGREVKTLLNEEQSAGMHEVSFDGSMLPSGIYFYTMHAGNFVRTNKMVLVK
jgi:alpha-glucosidase (family GH31 glycosyl hydrolase)